MILFRLLPTIIILWLFDRATKEYALAYHNLHPLIINPFMYCITEFNQGSSFSLIEGNHYWERTFLLIAPVLCVIIVYYYFSHLFLPTALIISGALGNFYDRIAYSAVIDFILLQYNSFNFPLFNLADSYIFFGTILLIYYIIRNTND